MYYKKLWDDYTFNNNNIKNMISEGDVKKRGRSKDYINMKKLSYFFLLKQQATKMAKIMKNVQNITKINFL